MWPEPFETFLLGIGTNCRKQASKENVLQVFDFKNYSLD